MLRFTLIRLGQGLVTMFFLATLVFVLARVVGNPVDMMLPSDATNAERDGLVQKLGLDQPYHQQYLQFVQGLLRGDVGDSIQYGRPVAQLFLERLPNTLGLALVAFAIAISIGAILGVVSATHRGSIIDTASRAIAVIGISAPSFWIGLLLILLFAVQLQWLPVARMGGPASYILPGFTWSLFLLAGTARLLRSSMIEVLDSEYVKLARIKGVSSGVVIWKHGLRNALLPVVTFAGMQVGALLGGSVAVESVFAWPGVGRLIYGGIVGRDYPLLQGCLLMTGFIIITINFIVDILYSVIDPRIRLGGAPR